MLKRGQYEICRKIYWITNIVKKWGLKKIKTKNILAGWGKLKFRKKVLQNFSGLTTISSYYWKPLKTWMLKKITTFYPRPTVIYVLVFLPSVVSFYKKLLFLYQTLLNLKKSKSYPIIVPDVFPLGLWSRPTATRYNSYHFQNRSVPTPLRYENHAEKICSNGNRRPIRYENWNGAIATRDDGNIVLTFNSIFDELKVVKYFKK